MLTKVRSLVFSICFWGLLKLASFYSRRVFSSRSYVQSCIRGSIHLEAFNKFPGRAFLEVETLAIELSYRLIACDEISQPFSQEESKLIEAAFAGNELERLIAVAHHHTAHVHDTYAKLGASDIEYDVAISRAVAAESSVEPITFDNFEKIRSKYKRRARYLRKKVTKHQKNQIYQNMWDGLPKVRLTASWTAIALGLLSTLLYFGGHLYSQIYYRRLSIDPNNYLDLFDQFMAGLTSTSSAMIMVGLSFVFYAMLLHDKLLAEQVAFHYEPANSQATVQRRNRAGALGDSCSGRVISHAEPERITKAQRQVRKLDRLVIACAIILVFGGGLFAYLTGERVAEAIRLPIAMIIPLALAWSGVFRIFKNPVVAYLTTVSIIHFLMSVAVQGYDDADIVLSGNCPSDKQVTQTSEPLDGTTRCVVGVSHSWVLEFDPSSEKVRVIPRERIDTIE